MSKPSDDGAVPVRRLDRVLATMAFGLMVLSVACFIALIIGVNNLGADPRTGMWPTATAILYFAPPVALVLMLVVIVRAIMRRVRANRAR